MGQEFPGFLNGFGLGPTLRRWQRALKDPKQLPTSDLDRMHGQIRGMRDRLDSMAAKARTELRTRSKLAEGIDRPDQCDWAVRPAPWHEEMRPRGLVNLSSPQKLPGGVTLFHDANHADMSLRQELAPSWMEGAQFGLVLEVYRSDGSFVSLVQDLPQEALNGTDPQSLHLVEADRGSRTTGRDLRPPEHSTRA